MFELGLGSVFDSLLIFCLAFFIDYILVNCQDSILRRCGMDNIAGYVKPKIRNKNSNGWRR
jgi:hypothetical protein